MYLLNPAVGAFGFTNILFDPLIIVSAVVLLFLKIKFTKLLFDEDDKCNKLAASTENPDGAKTKLPDMVFILINPLAKGEVSALPNINPSLE
jgi:hypothetical protein